MMTKKLFAIMALLFVGSWRLAAQTNGGPDAYGYTWTSSDHPGGGISVDWMDMTDATTVDGLADDNYIGPIPIGFDFPYYWQSFNSLYIGSNGYVMFGQGMNVASGGTGFPTFPTQGSAAQPNNFIGVLLSDLTLTDTDGLPIPTARVSYKGGEDDNGPFFCVAFENVPFWTDETPEHYRGSNYFQVILRPNGNFKANYQSSTGPVDASYQTVRFISRGFENVTGTVGLEFRSNVYPSNESIQVIYPNPPNPGYTFRNIRPVWALNEDRGGQILAKTSGEEYYVTAMIRNEGTVPICPSCSVRVRQRIFDFVNNNSPLDQYTDEIIINAPLAAGESRLVTFTKPILLDLATDYRIRITTTLLGESDQFLSDDNMDVELVVVDTSASSFVVGFDPFQFGIQWNQQNGDGLTSNLTVGTEIMPPYYPAIIEKAQFGLFIGTNDFINQQGDTIAVPDTIAGFTMRMFRSNAEGGVGSLIHEAVVTPEQILAMYPHTQPQGTFRQLNVDVYLPTPVILGDGETVFISWKRNDESLEGGRGLDFLMVGDQTTSAPVSFRTYEIAGQFWGSYRERSAADFAIRLGVTKANFVLQASANPTSVNCGGTSQLSASASPSDNVTYSWAPSAGLSNPNIANPSASPTLTTTYTVTATNSVTGQSSQKLVTVTVNSPLLSLSGLASEICPGETPTVTPTPAGTYIWSINEGATTTGATFTLPADLAAGQTFTLTAVSPNGCYAAARNFATRNAPRPVIQRQGLKLNITNPQTGAGYQWYFSDGETEQAIFEQTNTNVDLEGDGYYFVEQIFEGCTTRSESYYYEFVSRKPELFASARVYPNPSDGQFTLEMAEVRANQAYVSITDVRGAEVLKRTVSGGNVRETLEIQTPGLYLLKVSVGTEIFTRTLSVK